MNDNVVPIRPKSTREVYRKHTITITYNPTEKSWHWSFEHSVPFDGDAKSLGEAHRKAKKKIDRILDGE